MSAALSLKHCRHILRPYFLTIPWRLKHTRLRPHSPKLTNNEPQTLGPTQQTYACRHPNEGEYNGGSSKQAQQLAARASSLGEHLGVVTLAKKLTSVSVAVSALQLLKAAGERKTKGPPWALPLPPVQSACIT